MKYQIHHRTRYTYEGPVTVSHHVARLVPRSLGSQRCPWHVLEVQPTPVARGVNIDAFGNTATYFEVEGKHDTLEVTARSLVEVVAQGRQDDFGTPSWESVRDACHSERLTPGSDAGWFRFGSPVVPLAREFAEYARRDFTPGRPVLEAARAFMGRIFRECSFDPRATEVSTPVAEVLAKRAGVCQDFAHLMIACLRSLGVPARYISGYLETLPPPGKPRLVGADASHAWVAVFCGEESGWVDFDPTNNLLPGERHITLAWGRDYSDVSPLRGVTIGAGGQHLEIAVDVMPVGDL